MHLITFLVCNAIMRQTQNESVSISVEKTNSRTSRFFQNRENLILNYDDSHQDMTERSCGVWRRTYNSPGRTIQTPVNQQQFEESLLASLY